MFVLAMAGQDASRFVVRLMSVKVDQMEVMVGRVGMFGWRQQPTCHPFLSSRIIRFNEQAMERMDKASCDMVAKVRIASSWSPRVLS
jgi:hypothetical protein